MAFRRSVTTRASLFMEFLELTTFKSHATDQVSLLTSSNITTRRRYVGNRNEQKPLTNETGKRQNTTESLTTTQQKPDIVLHIGSSTCSFAVKLPTTTSSSSSSRDAADELYQFKFSRSIEKVGDVTKAIQRELSTCTDGSVKKTNVAFYNAVGARISSSSDLIALTSSTKLVIGDNIPQSIRVVMEKPSTSDSEQLNELKALIAQLHASLRVMDTLHDKEHALLKRVGELQPQIAPLEQQKWQLANKAERRASLFGWLGLGVMGFQFGFLARLTFWEYSWDIIEPVTYFVTYGTAVGMYAYFLLTRQEYVFPHVLDRQSLIAFHKRASRAGFDSARYNDLRQELQRLQEELAKTRMMRQMQQLQPPCSVANSSSSAVINDLDQITKNSTT